jgi:hypothetical protein
MRLNSILPLFALAVTLIAPQATAADAPADFKVGEFTFARPSAWEWVESTSSMRKAQLKIAGTGQESAEVVFFFFGAGGGGGTQANIDRWLGQFKEPREQLKSKTETATVSGRKVSFVQAEGTYLSGMPGGPKTPQSNTMLLGAILESDEGNVFIRVTGPAKLVKDSQPVFRKMIDTVKAGK